MKKHLWTIAYAVLLIGFTTYLALDTFVLGRAYQGAATEMNLAMFESIAETAPPLTAQEPSAPVETAPEPTDEPELADETETETEAEPEETEAPQAAEPAELQFSQVDPSGGEIIGSYSDGRMQITLVEYRAYDTVIYAADVQLSSAEFLKTAFAEDTYGKNITQKTSAIAAAHDAILAVNGDFYGTQESGYVIRNGVLYRDSAKRNTDVLCVYADGTLEIVRGEDVAAQTLVDSGIWQAFSFGPGLLDGGEITVSETDEVGKAMASNPRTAIGMIAPLHYVLVVSDGRTGDSQGLSLYQLAEFMQGLDVQTAYNLDGGGSSTMVFEGAVVNNPTTGGSRTKERSVSDIVYVG